MTLAAARPAPLNLLQGLVIGAVLLFPFLAYFGTAASIVAIWNRSDTFAHGYIILPISLWLVWQRRERIMQMQVLPYWPALLALAAFGFAWLLAELGEVQIVRQYAFVAMLPLSVLAILGVRMARAMAFPLLFLMFAVPFGEIFTEPLMGITANFTVDALVATGIPVYREGNNFTIPSGSWSVVEACSGVRYLISSFTLGCLYAYLTYRSAWRRALFVLMSLIVPIVANGLRAYMVVMTGHLSGMTMAVGFDHLVYGWVWFGIVMFLLFWIGSFWREDRLPEAGSPALVPPRQSSAPAGRIVAAALAVVICVGIWPAYLIYLEKTEPAPAPVVLSGFQPAAQPGTPFASDWVPDFPASSAQLQQYFVQDGHAVGLSALYYRHPPEGVKLISSTNRLVRGKDRAWRDLGMTLRTEMLRGRALALRETTLAGPSARMLVWHWYWIDGTTTSNDYVGKLLQVRQKLLHGSDDGAAVMVFSPYDENQDLARAALRGFLNSHFDSLDAALSVNKRHSFVSTP